MKKKSDINNILVYRIGHLGDTIVALPAFWEIRSRFPNAKITLLTNSDSRNKNYVMAKSILPETDLFDNYLSYDNSAEKFNKVLTYAGLFFKIKKGNFDSLYYLSTRNRTNYQIDRDVKFFRWAGIKNIFGVEYLKQNQLDFRQAKPLPTVESEYQFLINSLPKETFGNVEVKNHALLLTDAEKQKAIKWLKENCSNDFENKKLIAVAPGSKWRSKIWFEDRYSKVLNKLIDEFDVFPVIFGGKEDFETGQRILSKSGVGANSAGELNIRESSAALEHCIFYLGNDTGTMHMAAAVGLPCIAIFAATDFKGRWYPFGRQNKIFRKTVECEGCHTPECFNNYKCLELVTVEEVLEACREFFKNE